MYKQNKIIFQLTVTSIAVAAGIWYLSAQKTELRNPSTTASQENGSAEMAPLDGSTIKSGTAGAPALAFDQAKGIALKQELVRKQEDELAQQRSIYKDPPAESQKIVSKSSQISREGLNDSEQALKTIQEIDDSEQI